MLLSYTIYFPWLGVLLSFGRHFSAYAPRAVRTNFSRSSWWYCTTKIRTKNADHLSTTTRNFMHRKIKPTKLRCACLGLLPTATPATEVAVDDHRKQSTEQNCSPSTANSHQQNYGANARAFCPPLPPPLPPQGSRWQWTTAKTRSPALVAGHHHFRRGRAVDTNKNWSTRILTTTTHKHNKLTLGNCGVHVRDFCPPPPTIAELGVAVSNISNISTIHRHIDYSYLT